MQKRSRWENGNNGLLIQYEKYLQMP